MPAVEPKALHDIVVTVAANYLWQAGVWRTKFCIVCFIAAGSSSCIKIVRAAEIVFGSCSTDRWELCVAIHEEFYFAFAPPAIVVCAIRHISTHILTLALYAVEYCIIRFVWQPVYPAKLGMKM